MNKEKYINDVKVRYHLTPREVDTLRGLLEGLKNADIASDLMISEQTVKDHLSKIYKKMGVKNRFDLMRSMIKIHGRKGRTPNPARPAGHPLVTGIREASLTDELTGIYNRSAFLALAEHQLKVARRQKKNVCVLHAEVNDAGEADAAAANEEKDSALKDATNVLKETFRESDVVARVGGNEFAVIPLGVTEDETVRLEARLKRNVELFNSKRTGEHGLTISYDTSLYDPETPSSIEELLSRTASDKHKK